MNLISAGVSYWGVVTRLTLEPTQSAAGADFSRIFFTLERRLKTEQAKTLEPYHQRMRAFLQPMLVDASAYEIEEEIPEAVVPTETEETEGPEVPF